MVYIYIAIQHKGDASPESRFFWLKVLTDGEFL